MTSFDLFTSLIILIMIAYYLIFYLKYKFIDPSKTVITKSPPGDLSPAAMRYIWNSGYDSDCLLSGMLSASSTGAYGIVWYPNKFAIRLKNPNLLSQLHKDERAALFFSNNRPVKTLSFESERNQFTDRAEERMRNNLEKTYASLLSNRDQYQKRGLILASTLFSLVLWLVTPFIFVEALLFGVLLGGTAIAFQWFLDGILGGWDWFFGIRDFLMASAGGSLLALADWIAVPETFYTHYFLAILFVSSLGYIYMPKFTEEGETIWYKINGYRKHLIEANDSIFYQEDESILANQIALTVKSEATKPFDSLLTKQKPPDYSDDMITPWYMRF